MLLSGTPSGQSEVVVELVIGRHPQKKNLSFKKIPLPLKDPLSAAPKVRPQKCQSFVQKLRGALFYLEHICTRLTAQL